MAGSDKIALWILDKLNEVGFDENDYFIGLHKFKRILDAMSPTDEWKQMAVDKTETVVR